jgi:hypothetical protein
MSLQDVLPIMFLLDKMRERNFQVICTAPHVYCKVFEDKSGSLELNLLPKLCPRTKHINGVLSSLPRARALKEGRDLPHWNQGSDCGHLNKGAPTEHLLPTSPSHVWTVTQDALVRECEIYCTTALTLQPFLESRIVFSVRIFSPRFLGYPL